MKRILCIMLVLSLSLTSVFAFDLTDPDALRDTLSGVAEQIVTTIPTEVSVDNIWADAYIGQLLALPPHLAVGANVGSAFIKDNSLLDGIADLTGIDQLSMLPGAPIPAASINARIGGIILPFDIGFHFMGLHIGSQDNPINGAIDINTWGADFRYPLLKQKLIIPAISVAIGYDQVDTSGSLLLANDSDPSQNLGFNFGVASHLVTGTAEVSWNLLFLKIFAGARAMQPLDGITAAASIYLNNTQQGEPISFTADGMSLHVFGGIGLRLLVLDTTIGASYDVTNGNFGASLSLRVQL